MNTTEFLPIAVNTAGWHVLFTESKDPSEAVVPRQFRPRRWFHICLITEDGVRSPWLTVPPEEEPPGAARTRVIAGLWRENVVYIGEMAAPKAFTFEFGRKPE